MQTLVRARSIFNRKLNKISLQVIRLDKLLYSSHSTLRTLQNADCHIHRMPTELLMTTINCITQEAISIADNIPLNKVPPARNHSMQVPGNLQLVCRYWRRAFPAPPYFYSAIVLDESSRRFDPSYLDEPSRRFSPSESYLNSYLAKSGSYPLFVSSSTRESLNVVVVQHIHRVRRLQLKYHIGSLVDPSPQGSLKTFSKPAPLLESLDIDISGERIDIPAIDLESIFSDTLPRLQRLKLSGVRGWGENQFGLCRLTHLLLIGRWAMHESFEDFYRLLDLLRDQQCLQEVYVSNLDLWITRDDHRRPAIFVANDGRPKIILSRQLQRFAVGDSSAAQIRIFLSHFIYPVHAALSITNSSDTFRIFPDSGQLTSYQNLTDIYSTSWTVHRHVYVVTAVGESGALRISCSIARLKAGQNRRDSVIEKAFTLLTRSFAHSIRELHLCRRDLQIVGGGPNWSAMFSPLTSLQYLYIDNCECRAQQQRVLHALTHVTHNYRTQEAHVVCEKLESIIVNEFPFPCDLSDFFSLLFFVGTRRHLGFPIRRIQVAFASLERKLTDEGLERKLTDEEEEEHIHVLTLLDVLRRYVDTVEVKNKLCWTGIPAHLNERVHEEYWPKWE